MQRLDGKIGNSDMHGQVAVDRRDKRSLITADITSHLLNYKDLGGLIGMPPGEKGKGKAPEQQHAAERRAGSARVLPNKEYDLQRLRSVDADVSFNGERIVAYDVPFDNLKIHAKLSEGKLHLSPLEFGIAGGQVVTNAALDATQDVIHTTADLSIRNLELRRLIPSLKPSQGSAGKVGGRAKFTSVGNSIAAIAGAANGDFALFLSGGHASTITLFLTNLDLANVAQRLIFGDQNATIRCVVASAEIKQGVMTPRVLLMDSSEENITGTGSVDLRNELYKLRLVADSKRASLLALRGPILVSGTFKHPTVGPEVGPLAARAGGALALGALLGPLAALLPMIDFGGAPDSNCAGLVKQAKQGVAKSQPGARPVSRDPARRSSRAAVANPERDRAVQPSTATKAR